MNRKNVSTPDASVGASGRNIKLTIEYAGTSYSGWQAQNSCQLSAVSCQQKTIQETIEKALQKILQEKIKVVGSGRTDAGVHAQAQVANFKTDSSIAIEKLRKALNAVLPDDISVIRTEEVRAGFHSRFSAKSKVYRYTILNRPSRSAILRDTAYFFPYPLNLKLMRKEAGVLLGRHNFKSFQAADKRERGATRTIKNIKIIRDKDFIYIDIEADGFLYNMVRNIAGTLIEIGRGKFSEGSTKKILLARNRKFAGPTVPAKGLCLLEVKYKDTQTRSPQLSTS
ncbi:MAG: tRNA pseudouridine(38-40) synthase TruA [Candidatus Omnitrophota bacterium]|nr:tRNA pseudouridine(38-40) synthase TruA [Candidatus Omnitrophota bacterium]